MVLQKMNQSEQQELIKMQQQMAAIEGQAKQYLDRGALSRFGNIKVADPQKAFQVAVLLVQAAQAGQINGQLDDATFKNLLLSFQGQKKEFRLNRR